MPINAAGQMRNLRNWKRKAPRVSCERRSQQGETRKNHILEGEKHIGLAHLSADERIKLLSPDQLRDTLRLHLRGIT